MASYMPSDKFLAIWNQSESADECAERCNAITGGKMKAATAATKASKVRANIRDAVLEQMFEVSGEDDRDAFLEDPENIAAAKEEAKLAVKSMPRKGGGGGAGRARIDWLGLKALGEQSQKADFDVDSFVADDGADDSAEDASEDAPAPKTRRLKKSK